jgi:hypothetical protein
MKTPIRHQARKEALDRLPTTIPQLIKTTTTLAMTTPQIIRPPPTTPNSLKMTTLAATLTTPHPDAPISRRCLHPRDNRDDACDMESARSRSTRTVAVGTGRTRSQFTVSGIFTTGTQIRVSEYVGVKEDIAPIYMCLRFPGKSEARRILSPGTYKPQMDR